MFVSRLLSANNPKAPINMLDTSRSFQKVWGFKSFTRTHYSSAGIIPSRAGHNFIPHTHREWVGKWIPWVTIVVCAQSLIKIVWVCTMCVCMRRKEREGLGLGFGINYGLGLC